MLYFTCQVIFSSQLIRRFRADTGLKTLLLIRLCMFSRTKLSNSAKRKTAFRIFLTHSRKSFANVFRQIRCNLCNPYFRFQTFVPIRLRLPCNCFIVVFFQSFFLMSLVLFSDSFHHLLRHGVLVKNHWGLDGYRVLSKILASIMKIYFISKTVQK